MSIITDSSIESLRTESAEAGDMLACRICEIALGRLDDDSDLPGVQVALAEYDMDSARAECAAMVAEVRASRATEMLGGKRAAATSPGRCSRCGLAGHNRRTCEART